MEYVLIVRDDIDRHGAGCECGRCDSNGKSYGVSTYPIDADLAAIDPYRAIDEAAAGDPLDRAYAASEATAYITAREVAAWHQWAEISPAL